jgi:hypothetical protein
MGIDDISLFFVLLATLLTVLCIAASGIRCTAGREYMISFLVLETMMVGIYCALDFVCSMCSSRGAGPDVPDHRGVGKRPGLCRV